MLLEEHRPAAEAAGATSPSLFIVARKLAEVGCAVEPMTDWDTAEAFTFAPQELEKLAQTEHERWIKERQAKGWRYAPGPKNLKTRTTPYLVPWSELSDQVKDYDRDAVRQLPSALTGVGLQIRRLA